MEHIALYRRYRPKNFLEVIGQDNIVKILKNQIITEKIGHAYLFSGTRGTGKTSAAKIFAKAVNCENNKTGDPCQDCKTCTEIDNNNVMDIVEIDAASNRGVDEIRELRERVKYPPTLGSYKVYIIDEVHMLTTEAFNALLKTLEEPPKHVIFILATTEPNKLPTTILSRCQRFHFKRLELKDIYSRMNYICNELNVQIEEKTLKLIAKNADGAMRDALSILEQCLSISDDNMVDYNSVKELLGISGDELLYGLIENIIHKDIHSALASLEEAYGNGKEIAQLASQMVVCLRDMLILKVTNSSDNLMESSEENTEILRKLSIQIENELLSYYIESLAEMESKIKYSSLPKVLMEVLLIKFCSASLSTDRATNSSVKMSRENVETEKTQKNVVQSNQNKDDVRQEARQVKGNVGFETLCNAIKKDRPLIGTALEMGICKEISNEKCSVAFDKDNFFHYNTVHKNRQYIETQVKKIIDPNCYFYCETQENKGEDFLNRTKEIFGEDKVFLTDK